ncbi:hypothetical protein LR948_11510 [Roseivivax sp. GX 12232]|uniref:hypothetical protein n=1 Tax=Roseivivax sp. GX 12232 TaxID=2900547 RepID=UPI001E39AC0A|nr:hypothetical protein [Roseivivax sp. GX 12232]MCE0505987.1 hypothetical protein [Roseivivax sp. GX 12232]
MVIRVLALLAACFCLSCNSGGPGFSGLPAETVTQDGSRFLLRRDGPLLEAQRVSPEWLPRFQPVARKAGTAAERRTGCRVAWVTGDQAMMLLGLACPGGPDPPPPPRNRYWSCEALTQSRDLGGGLTASDIALSCRRR